METLFDIPVMTCKDESAWVSWLHENHTDQTGIWLKIAKKDSNVPSVTQPEALDACLCYGWIDGQRRAYDETYYLQKYTPRRKRSLWSKVNIAKVEALTAQGRMREWGQREIDLAKADGRWGAAYESQRNAVTPPDLEAALSLHPIAKEFYETLTRAEKYTVLHRLMIARTPDARHARLMAMVSTLDSRKKI